MKRILMMVLALMLCFGVFVSGVGADTEGYDDTSEIARWKKVATLPITYLENMGAVKEKIYVMGSGSSIKLNIFDLKTKKWTVGRDMIAKASNMTAIATVNDKLYVISGDESGVPSSVQIYDPETNKWTPGTRMPVRLSAAACVAVGDNLYLFGGYKYDDKGNSSYISSTYIYNTKTDTWTSGTAIPGSGRYGMKACAVGKMVYVMGGQMSGSSISNEMYAYDTETDTWGKNIGMPNNGKLKTAVSIGENIYAICFLGDNTSKQIDVYNTTTKIWSTKTKDWPKGAELPDVLGNNSFVFQALAINGTIYAMDSKNILSMEAAPPAERSQLSVGLIVGQSIQMNGTGSLADNTDLTWTSSDSAVASVDKSGKVSALKKGSASISASNADGAAEQSLAIEVTEPEPATTAPAVTGVRWTDSGAVVMAKGEKEIAMYGISTTTNSNAANWKRSNVFNSVKVGTTYYFFAKDEDGTISEPFEFKRVE